MAKRLEGEEERSPKTNKVKKYIKVILFITSLVLSYFATEYAVNYVATLSLELIKRVVNIILVIVIVIIALKK